MPAKRARLLFAVCRQRNFGAAGVLAGQRPFGFAMPDQVDGRDFTHSHRSGRRFASSWRTIFVAQPKQQVLARIPCYPVFTDARLT